MAYIELVIRLPEEKYNIIKNKMYCGIYDPDLYKAIANGTPLDDVKNTLGSFDEYVKRTNSSLKKLQAEANRLKLEVEALKREPCEDTISRQAAISAAEKESQIDGAYGYMDTKSIINMLENLPSTQSEIIHCAECVHWKHSTIRKSYCEVFDWVNTAEDFCSFAERRN